LAAFFKSNSQPRMLSCLRYGVSANEAAEAAAQISAALPFCASVLLFSPKATQLPPGSEMMRRDVFR
jgi:hypothetical protein